MSSDTANIFSRPYNIIKNYRDVGYYLLSSFVGAGLGFLLLPVYTHYLNPADYGIIGYAQSVNSFLAPLLQLSFSTYYIKKFFEKPDADTRQELLGSLMCFLFLWNLIMISALLLIGELVFSVIGIKFNFFPYMTLMILSNLFISFYNFLLIQYRMEKKPLAYLINSIINALIVLGFPLLTIMYWSSDAYGRILGFCLGTTLSGILSFILLKGKMSFTLNKDIIADAYRFSAPLIPYTLILLFYDTLDRIYIEKYSSLTDLGYYNIAMQFSTILYTFAISYYRATEADYFHLAAQGKISLLYRKMFYAIFLFLALSALIMVSSKWLIIQFTNDSFLPSINIIRKLILASFIQSCNLLIFTILTIQSRTRAMLLISFMGLVTYIIALVFLGDYYSIDGVVWSKVILHISLLIISTFFIKEFSIRRNIVGMILLGYILLWLLYLYLIG